MGIEDFFEQNHKHHKKDFDNHQEYHKYKEESHSDYQNIDLKFQILNKMKSNPKLKKYLIIAAIAILILAIVLIIALMPLLIKLIDFIQQNGIKGLIDVILNGTK